MSSTHPRVKELGFKQDARIGPGNFNLLVHARPARRRRAEMRGRSLSRGARGETAPLGADVTRVPETLPGRAPRRFLGVLLGPRSRGCALKLRRGHDD